MNGTKTSPEDLAEDQSMVATLRANGLTEYEACMFVGLIRQVAA
jgi:hypothetical protein